MKRILPLLIIIIGLGILVVVLSNVSDDSGDILSSFSLRKERAAQNNNISKREMILSSPVFDYNGFIPKKYTCDGDNLFPPLKIQGVPVGTKSLAFIVDDPDAPMGTWLHWTAWNIPADTSYIDFDNLPNGIVEGVTDFGTTGYGGPCPPSGIHRYFFKLFALRKKLDLTPGIEIDELEEEINRFTLEKTELMGVYSRN